MPCKHIPIIARIWRSNNYVKNSVSGPNGGTVCQPLCGSDDTDFNAFVTLRHVIEVQ